MLTTNFFDRTVVQELKNLDDTRRRSLIQQLWPDAIDDRGIVDNFSCKAYFEYLANELDQLRHYRHLFAAQSFESTFGIIKTLRDKNTTTYAEILDSLGNHYPDASRDALRRSVELSLRMWLTVNVHHSDIYTGPIAAGDQPLDWAQDECLEQLFRGKFGRNVHLQRQRTTAKFDTALTAAYLVGTCGMRLHWTDDLAAHLGYDSNRRVLTVYRHKACLLNHADYHRGCPIPRDVLEEALETMDLLFPPWDNPTKQLLVREKQQSLFRLGCRRPVRTFDIAHYQYFGGSLEHIIESFDKTPRTWKQLAFDRRNKLEWSAFWMTVFVAVLTLVSIPCNIIQATYSVKAYNLAVAQGRNSLAFP
ncbi:hypothetical protein BKA63DRAFT_73422 [Paraphoma chrysanthemicola]|nr:hypothetical protein BKA63DRAFT_73422 [Paraphoma chrysanthemicola]